MRLKLQSLKQRIQSAALKTGRSLEDVALVAVTKTAEPAEILEAAEAGLRVFGENRVQEAARKIQAVQFPSVEWHLVGHLQTNKAAQAVSRFSMIQSVDSIKIAKAVSDEALRQQKTMPVLLEVNISGQPRRYGFSWEEVEEAAPRMAKFSGIRVEGLMGIAPHPAEDTEKRKCFRKLKDLFLKLGPMKYLSMGMSDDFEMAIEEGSNMVRIGRALFQ